MSKTASIFAGIFILSCVLVSIIGANPSGPMDRPAAKAILYTGDDVVSGAAAVSSSNARLLQLTCWLTGSGTNNVLLSCSKPCALVQHAALARAMCIVLLLDVNAIVVDALVNEAQVQPRPQPLRFEIFSVETRDFNI